VQVADRGTGVDFESLTAAENIFNLGYEPVNKGPMNEHGFGLKNALALMTSGFQTEFLFLTKQEEGVLWGVKGPIQEAMEALKMEQVVWEKNLEKLKEATTGVKVVVGVRPEYFHTIYSRPVNFET